MKMFWVMALSVFAALGLSALFLEQLESRMRADTSPEIPAPGARAAKLTAQAAARRDTAAAPTPPPGIEDAETDGSGPEPALVASSYLYKWRSGNGTIHIESWAPLDRSEFEIFRFDRPFDTIASSPRPPPQKRAHTGALSQTPFSVYAPGGISQLLNLVDQTVKQLEHRQKEINRLTAEL